MNHTALRAAHMDIFLDESGGGEMIKLRLQGTKEDIEWLEKQLNSCSQVKVLESSESFNNKGTNRYFRKYIEVTKK